MRKKLFDQKLLISMTKEMKKKLEEEAENQDTTVNQLVRSYIKKGLETWK